MKKLIFNKRETGSQFLKFCLIGFLNTAIHYGIFIFFLRTLLVNYLIASVFGYCTGLINSYILNKKWTFQSTGVRKDAEFAKFVLVNVFALSANLGALKCFVCLMSMAPELGQVFAIGFSTTTNFIGNKFWTFQKAG